MVAIVLGFVIVLGVFLTYRKMLNCDDVEEGSTTISFPLKIEFRFKKRTDKPSDRPSEKSMDKPPEKSMDELSEKST